VTWNPWRGRRVPARRKVQRSRVKDASSGLSVPLGEVIMNGSLNQMMRRPILIGACLTAALLGTSATAFALSTTAHKTAASESARSSSSSGRRSSSTSQCDINRLRVTGTSQTSGYGTFGTRSRYLVMHVMNVGPGCVIAPGSGFAVAGSTNTHVAIHARLRGKALRVGPRARVRLVLGTWWKIGAASGAHYSCPSVHISSIVLRRDGNSTTVSLRHPFSVCTPLKSDFRIAAR
jgi:hypothetical protein